MELDRNSWWTRRRETELAHRDVALHGAGIPSVVLRTAAELLGQPFSVSASLDDEYGEEISVGDASGSTHDGCFFWLAPASPTLKRAVVDAALTLHSHYLGCDVDWSRVAPEIVDSLKPGRVLRLRTSRARRRVTVRSFQADAGLVARLLAKPLEIDCSTGVALLKRGLKSSG
jgi:hypothetical protein